MNRTDEIFQQVWNLLVAAAKNNNHNWVKIGDDVVFLDSGFLLEKSVLDAVPELTEDRFDDFGRYLKRLRQQR